MKKLIFFLLLMAILPSAFARSAHMKLLAVADAAGTEYGSTADLYLEIKPGSGNVYIDSFPLTKLDTQITTRFAKEIACDFLERDCSNYDFFYTIRASSSIVGGPSASAAITILTISVLDDLKLDDKATITGTINSGGLIGPVGGVLPKIAAAAGINMTKVLIPKWSAVNETNLTDYREKYRIQIIPVSDLADSVYQLTGRNYTKRYDFVLSSSYLDTMKNISESLCTRTALLATAYGGNNSMENDAYSLYSKGNQSVSDGKYYSGASYCFGANVKFNYLRLSRGDAQTKDTIANSVTNYLNLSEGFNRYLQGKEVNTITDLQTFVVVSERVAEAKDYFQAAITDLKTNNTNVSLYDLAFGVERLNSAYSWSDFFGKDGAKFKINSKTLQASCLNKISEVEERMEYLKVYLPDVPDNIVKELNYAYEGSRNSDFEMCLYRASKAKADVDILLNSIGLSESQMDEVIANRLSVVQQEISRQSRKGIFPIIGYSYYEYANSLKDTDKYSALLYLEYALELSNMDLYFEKEQFVLPWIEIRDVALISLGAAAGFLIGLAIMHPGLRKKKRQ